MSRLRKAEFKGGNMKTLFLFIIAAFFTVLLGACAHQSGGIAPSTTPLKPDSYRILGEVKGEDCVYYLLGLIPLSDGNETKIALQNALAQAPDASALIDVTSDSYSQWFIIVTRACTQVYGTAVAPR